MKRGSINIIKTANVDAINRRVSAALMKGINPACLAEIMPCGVGVAVVRRGHKLCGTKQRSPARGVTNLRDMRAKVA